MARRNGSHATVRVGKWVSLEANTKATAKRAIWAFVALGLVALVLMKGPEAWNFLADQLARLAEWVWGGVWNYILRPIVNFLTESIISGLLVAAIIGLLGAAEVHATNGRSRGIHSGMRENPRNTAVIALCLGAVIAFIAMSHGVLVI